MGCSGCNDNARKRPASQRHRSKTARSEFKKKNYMERFGVFGTGRVKDFIVFYELMEELGATIDDVRQWVEVKEGKRRAEDAKVAMEIKEFSHFLNAKPACPRCGKMLGAYNVNNMPCNQVGGKYTFVISCQDQLGCGYEEYIKDTLRDWTLKMKRQRVKAIKEIRELKRLQREGEQKEKKYAD